jgi:hypothetical protein
MLSLDARLAAVAVTQHGVFTRAQALAAGYSTAQIHRRTRLSVWERVLPRVYRHASTPNSAAVSHWAAVLWAGPGCALSHASAAAIWQMAISAPVAPELIVPSTRGPRTRNVTVHRASRIDDKDVTRVGRLPVTTPVRTIIDLSALLDVRDLEAVIRSARARGFVTIRAVHGRLDEIGTAGRPGAARLRTLLAALGSGRPDASARMAG